MLEERPLNDSLLSQYISHLHQEGKSPATIALVVAAVKWIAKHQGSDGVVGETTNLLADS